VVAACCGALDGELLAEYTAANAAALKVLRQETRVAFRRLPDSVLAALRKAADPVLDELVAGDAFARRVLDSMRAFRDDVRRWHALGEVAYYQARG
jgi:TRAP-type mannitol/chloroaromatic compound transport system substrate-binding protein